MPQHSPPAGRNDFNAHYPAIVQALAALLDETVVDGEVVALDESGRPSFNTLQNYGSAGAPVIYYIFDVLVLEGTNVTSTNSKLPTSSGRSQ
jgi:bifunctional non-homologous end joining protein LigD